MFKIKNLFKNLRGKRAMELEVLGWIILSLVILAILVVAYIYLNKQNLSAGEFLKNLFRFRR
jgi:multisubunit Na+/H+ antiporter MnhB subunit